MYYHVYNVLHAYYIIRFARERDIANNACSYLSKIIVHLVDINWICLKIMILAGEMKIIMFHILYVI